LQVKSYIPCQEHHRGTNGVHGKNGSKLDRALKLQFQNYLELLFNKPLLTREEIQEVLQIKDKPLDSLLKTLNLKECKYIREEVIRQCMGGKMIVEGVNNEN
jgi:hypothetical protein